MTISALEHWSYCPRQCGLIHIESTFDENLYTLRGRRLHERVHEPGADWEDGVRRVRGMPLFSVSLGLTGKADLIEFHGETPYPVEYKSGSTRERRHEALQLCAQALCLEEMLGVTVPAGAIFAQGSRRRSEIAFDDELRARVPAAVAEVRTMLGGTTLPAAANDSRCPRCSLFDACLPGVVDQEARIRGFFGELFHPAAGDDTL
ncbi:MAG: CRISPR-associated protein Cas4 [Thermomicrobiales bacterium]|nr:CRISPR-associated protein Cas4 [Thermomicrobiales bacterium]